MRLVHLSFVKTTLVSFIHIVLENKVGFNLSIFISYSCAFQAFHSCRENNVCFSLLQVEKNSADFNLPTVVHRFLNRCYCILP